MLKGGVGAILIVPETDWPSDNEPLIRTRAMEADTIARLEILTSLWAFELFEREAKGKSAGKITLFTDCRTIEKLSARRPRLEKRNFLSRRTGLLLKNADLYKKMFSVFDRHSPSIIWLKGHSPAEKQNAFSQCFSSVDKAARRELRRITLQAKSKT